MVGEPETTPNPKRTGTIFRYAPPKPGERLGHYVVRCSAPDGTRPLFHLEPSPESEDARAAALRTAGEISEELWSQGLGAAKKRTRSPRYVPGAGETVAGWFTRWLDERARRGIASVRSDRSRFKTHVEPVLGAFAMADLKRSHVEELVLSLDNRVAAGELSWKTAVNVWALVSKALDDACNAKNPELRVLTENPAAAVRGPDRGAHKAKTYLYPSEFLQVVTCEHVPLAWRRRIALAVYLFPRAAELEALEWSDVDVERGIVHIHRAIDRKERPTADEEAAKTKATKTGVTRRFAVEARVLPLLRAMHRESGGKGPVDPTMPPEAHLARELQVHLRAAKLERAELLTSDQTRKRLGFHDLRATGLTWMAVRGDDPLKIMQRAGHKEFKTTQGYIREAEAVRDGFGDVFPTLPESLLGTSSEPADGAGGAAPASPEARCHDPLSRVLSQATQVREIIVGVEGFEPTTTCTQSRSSTRLRYTPGRVRRDATTIASRSVVQPPRAFNPEWARGRRRGGWARRRRRRACRRGSSRRARW